MTPDTTIPAKSLAGSVLFGIDHLLAHPGQVAGRIGLVTNAAAHTADGLVPARVALQRAGFHLVRLFSPEHGLHATGADGQAMENSLDPQTGLPVISLYGQTLRPTRQQLQDLDAVLFDIPDIGSRFYTYIWTLSHVLEACAEAGRQLVVLDRPNPLGGDLAAAEGPLLDVERCSSFLGRASIPVRHSLTVGELAQLWNREWRLGASVQVIPCPGWNRRMHWPDTGRPFVRTSPAMASYESALLYPGLCLFEATNLNAGRGTECPFQMVGAPWLKSENVAADFNATGLPGVVAESQAYVPSQPPYAGEPCSGVRLYPTAPRRLRPVEAGLQLLATVIAAHPAQFRWSSYPTAANPTGQDHFERLIGQPGLREALAKGPAQVRQHLADWTATPGWAERVSDLLFYR